MAKNPYWFPAAFWVFLLVIGRVVAQDNAKIAQQLVDIADEAYGVQRAVDLANEQYVMAAQADPQNIRANWMAGQTHLETINRGQATQYFLQVYQLDPDYRFDLLYNIGWGYQLGMKFEKALEYYELYKRKLLANEEYLGRDKVPLQLVDRNIYECKNGLEFVANPQNFSIESVGLGVNSEWHDYAPVLNEDETMLIFTSRRKIDNLNEDVFDDNFPYEDIFVSIKKGESWSRAENIGSVINTLYFDSNLGLSSDAQTLYIYKDENGGDIYFSQRNEDGDYTRPQPMSDAINSSFSEKSVSISPDGSTLYFSSDRPGGLGGLDIYITKKDDQGNWQPAQNAGENINTEYDDDSPFIDYDGKTLYFSSKGQKGMGGFDIYKTLLDEKTQTWSTPVNLGYPINTPDNDIFFVSTKDGKRGYYSSVREDGFGYDDIYMITIPEVKTPPKKAAEVKKIQSQQVTLTVKVEEAGSNQPLDAQVTLIAMGNQQSVPGQKRGTGQYAFTVTAGSSSDYMISAEKQGYIFKNQRLKIPASSAGAQNLERTIRLSKVRARARSVLRNIYFDFDRASFKQESYLELGNLEKMMGQNQSIKVEISGHTDDEGSDNYNKSLSQRRADAVINYLSGKGIDSARLRAVGYGEERPMASNDDEQEGRELNRRVEFIILE